MDSVLGRRLGLRRRRGERSKQSFVGLADGVSRLRKLSAPELLPVRQLPRDFAIFMLRLNAVAHSNFVTA